MNNVLCVMRSFLADLHNFCFLISAEFSSCLISAEFSIGVMRRRSTPEAMGVCDGRNAYYSYSWVCVLFIVMGVMRIVHAHG